MRVIKMFFGMLIGSLLMLGLGWLIYVEGSLHWAAYDLRQDLHKTYLLGHAPLGGDGCFLERDTMVVVGDEDKPILGYRLRFEDQTQYVMEVVCGIGVDPIELERHSLPFGVVKAGGTGVMVPIGTRSESDLDAFVTLESHGRRLSTGFLEGKLTWTYRQTENPQSFGLDMAETTCTGAGYECCSAQTQAGMGALVPRVLDCRGACYITCRELPYVVYFNTTPVMEHTSRALEVSANPVTISFGFQVIPGEATISKVTVDFGDGVTEEVGSQAVLEHTYTCQSDLCTYEATLRGADDEGMAWVETPLNKVRIIQIP